MSMDHDNRLAEMARLIESFGQLMQPRVKQQLEQAHQFFGDFDELQRRLASSGKADFNVFALMRFNEDEVKHTQILAWLLDERSPHGQGNLFFKVFLKASGIEVSDEEMKGYYVRAERRGDGAITDIVIYRPPRFAIAIENKINANEGTNQLKQEFEDLKRLAETSQIPEEKLNGVFLTCYSHKPASQHDQKVWKALSHGVLASQFRACLPQVQDEKLRYFLSDLIKESERWSAQK